MRSLTYFLLLLITVLTVGCAQPEQTRNLELVGHRGATGFMPENSIPGFKKALDFGVNSIEFDVVISGDERVVISHEPWFRHDICLAPDGSTIDEESQRDHLIYKMTYEEIAQYDCGSKQRPGFPDQETQPLSKPLMKDALLEVKSYRTQNSYPPIEYNVEIKSRPAWDNKLQPEPEKVAKLVYEELQELDMLERIKIFAFDERILNAFHKIDSTVTQVYLIPGSKSDISANLAKLTHLPDVYAPNYSLVDSGLVKEVHSKGMRLIPWTVNNYEDMVRLVDLGVDGIISDYPNYFEEIRKLRSAPDQAEL